VADSLHISAGFFAALDDYAQAVNRAAEEAAQVGMERLVSSLQNAASQNDRWKSIAEHIEVWSQDGQLVVGVRNEGAVSEAVSAEYGDATNPPVPLIRNMPGALTDASQAMNKYMREEVGSRYAV